MSKKINCYQITLSHYYISCIGREVRRKSVVGSLKVERKCKSMCLHLAKIRTSYGQLAHTHQPSQHANTAKV